MAEMIFFFFFFFFFKLVAFADKERILYTLYIYYTSLGISSFYHLLTSTFETKESLHRTYTLFLQYL